MNTETNRGWIGVDLDGTLAIYYGWDGGKIGDPVVMMVCRVRAWVGQGKQVKIFTARVADGKPETLAAIQNWCEKHLGFILEVTNVKDMHMEALYDDRAVQVEKNTGRLILDCEHE